jgi:hypothetical protein
VPEDLPKDVNFSLGGAVLFIPKYKGPMNTALPLIPCSTRNGKMARFSAHSTAWAITSRKTPACNTPACRWKPHVTNPVLANCVDSAMSALRWSSGAFLELLIQSELFTVSSLRYGSGVDHNGLQVSLGAQQPR